MPDSSFPDLLRRRRQSLGPTYGLSYAEPLHFVRAEGVWMYGADGRAYLDAYNNVPVVGHCHPRVVEALTRQARVLNTNTRYLTDTPVELAERLLATMPAEITNVVFMCTGTEANEFAVRVSQAVTGGTGLIVTQHAYHGNGAMTAGLSPSATGSQLGKEVYTVPAPLGSDGPREFAGRVRACIERMTADGVRPAALILDTIFSSDGVVADPPGFLKDAVDEIRRAGGLFIADEVQPGLARTGETFWGFGRHGVVPDLVTIGKPMGNGHPVAAMAARGALTARFAERTRYFNTFGGNTVSCAVALAVLDVIQQENLMQNAKETGAYLWQGLSRLAQSHQVIGLIRGAGLYFGVEILDDQRLGLAAKQATQRIVNGLRQEGVLIGVSGANGTVLKIRPPLPFTTTHADLLLEKMSLVLSGR